MTAATVLQCWMLNTSSAWHHRRGCPASSARAIGPAAFPPAPTCLQTIFGECTWGNCCGAGCSCTEDSDAKDRLDRACRAHDVCYGALLMLCRRPASSCSAQHRCLAPRKQMPFGMCLLGCTFTIPQVALSNPHLTLSAGGDDWTDCDAICRCDRDLAEKADEVRD